MKKRTLTFLTTFALILFFLSFSNEVNGQSHCCCSACGGMPCLVFDPGPGSCAGTCFFGCGNPGGAEDSNDAACLGTTCNPLVPIKLVRFEVSVINEGVELYWETESERDNEGFEIQRMSGVDMDWEPLDFVRGNGTTEYAQDYYYFDRTPPPGNHYYRLKQIDFNGEFSYSEIKGASLDEKEKFTMWPTLAKNQVLLKTNEDFNLVYNLEIFDMMGRRVMQRTFEKAVSLNVSDLPKGHYIVNVSSSGNTETLRFVKVE